MIWVLLAIVAIVAWCTGALVGRWYERRQRPVVVSKPEPTRPLDVRRQFATRAREIAESSAAENRPALEYQVASFASEAWSQGVNELRQQIVANSALPPGIAEEMCSIALREMHRQWPSP